MDGGALDSFLLTGDDILRSIELRLRSSLSYYALMAGEKHDTR